MILKKETKILFSELGEKNWVYPSVSNSIVLSYDIEVEPLTSLFSGNPEFLAVKVKESSEVFFEGQIIWFSKNSKKD